MEIHIYICVWPVLNGSYGVNVSGVNVVAVDVMEGAHSV